jgi:DNA-binding protein H-NS
MKKGILFLFIVCAAAVRAEAQSLKDLLYSGKLKKDTSAVIRKTDDLQSKIDTAQKKQAEPEKPKPAAAPVAGQTEQGAGSTPVTAPDSVTFIEPSATNATASKSNTRIWKEYSDALLAALKTDVLSSKKVKKGTYYFTVNYEIDINGAVSITNVTVSPESAFLLDQVQQRLTSEPPQLQPVLDNNQPRKVKRKYNFTVTKD